MSENLNKLYQQYLNGEITSQQYQQAKKQTLFPQNPANPQPTPTQTVTPIQTPAPPVNPAIQMSYFQEDTPFESEPARQNQTQVNITNHEDGGNTERLTKMGKKIGRVNTFTMFNFLLILILGFTTFTNTNMQFYPQTAGEITTPEGSFTPVTPQQPDLELFEPPQSPTVLEFNEIGADNLVSSPQNYDNLMATAYRSIFQIQCTYTPGTSYVGAGWAAALNLPNGGTETLIVTNHHVIEECLTGGTITVKNDTYGEIEAIIYTAEGGYWERKTTGETNSLRDLATLQLKTTQKISGFPLQKQPTQLNQWVAAVGYPGNGENNISTRTTTTGTISEFENISRMIITTAEVKPGNSGGPLLNNRGEIVGTIFANSASQPGIGYAQPLQYGCTIIYECADGILTYGEDNLTNIYTPLQPGECLGYSLAGQFNLHNISCDSFNLTYQILNEQQNPTETTTCNTGTYIQEIVAGEQKTFCAKQFE